MQPSKPRYFHRSSLIPTCHEYRGGNDWKTFHTRATKFVNISPSGNWAIFPFDFEEILQTPKILNFNEFQPSSLELEREVGLEFF